MPLHFATWITAIARVYDSLNKPERAVVKLADGSSRIAYVKAIPSREITVEITCALLAQAIGLPVPDPILVQMPDAQPVRFGSLLVEAPPFLHFLRNDTAVLARLKAWPLVMPAACFDEWIANTDRHAGNVLHDGAVGFWLIDHGLALPATHVASALCAENKLFSVACLEATDLDIATKLRPVMLASMQHCSEASMAAIREHVDGIPLDSFDAMLEWLAERQPHLLRFVAQRLPTAQGDMFHGHPD